MSTFSSNSAARIVGRARPASCRKWRRSIRGAAHAVAGSGAMIAKQNAPLTVTVENAIEKLETKPASGAHYRYTQPRWLSGKR
jgi:hypothetical protein